MSEEANDIYVRELAKRLTGDFSGKNLSSKSYTALLASQENLPRSGSHSVNSSTYYLRAGNAKGQTALQPINENLANRNDYQQNLKNSFELNPKLALANPIIGPSSAKNFGESDFQENSDKMMIQDESYTQAGPPSFSKSGYPVQSKKGGGYEYRSFGKLTNETNRGDLSSQRNFDLSSKRTKRGKDQAQEVRECEIAKTVQESLKYVTKCKVHGQPFSLFNPTSKTLCCIECIYNNAKTTNKKAQVLSIKSAYPIICETNKIYKTEAKEKVMILEENVRACNQNIGIIQDSQENLVTQIRKEFNDVFEELKRREAFLLEQVSIAAEAEISKQKYKIDELEFLRNCFKDAREVDPTLSIELGVHFFGVYNLLKSYIKPFEIAGALISPDEFSNLDFGTRNLLKSEISNFGKFLNPKSPQKKLLSKSKSTTVKPRSESAQKNVIPDRSMSPIRSSNNVITAPKRTVTPEKQREPVSIKNLKSPPTTNLERDTIKKATKLKGSKSSGKLSTAEILTYNRQEESIPTLFPEPKEQNFAQEINVSSTKAARITEFDLSEYAEKSDSPIREKKIGSVDESASKVKTLARANEEFRREFGRVNESEISKERISEPTINKSVELINNLFLFHDSHVLSNELRNTDFYNMLPQHIKYTKLVYRMTQDGASSTAFHEKCDHQPNLVVIVKCNSKYVFGYYLPIPLVSEEKYNTCEDVFIFSLSNPHLDKPVKFQVKSDKKFISLYQSSKSPCLGSTLQNKQDLWIQFDNLANSCSNIGYAYKLPAGIDGTKALAGQYTGWDVEEIEVYKLFL